MRERRAGFRRGRASALPDAMRARVRIENVRPSIDCGRYPIKRTAGELVEVSADVFSDGHDRVRAKLLYRLETEREWHGLFMEEMGNDTFQGSFSTEERGRYVYQVEAWIDRFGSWASDLAKKHRSGQDIRSELLEGASLVGAAARGADGLERAWLEEQAELIARGLSDAQALIDSALEGTLGDRMLKNADRGPVVSSAPPLEVVVERPLARFGAWYEMFPRSAGEDPGRSGGFLEAEKRLHDIGAMGFDVLYLPPIHPIGHAHRKGSNNALDAAEGDPGSPWAIGSEEGGHKAVDPALGTLDDFVRFSEAAREAGLEVALDIAFQSSPDHPYVREHPEWFRHRPDGTIKHAENPPKKYQDIYPLDFDSDGWRELWLELKDVLLFWIERGVRIFRVDNPHTKPFRFWEWLIEEVRREFPDVIFLAEAFTRPKVLRHLAKLGFSQSYTYFTWRVTKEEITSYLTELSRTEVAEYLRPNLFVNTPDILHEFLQFGGRPAFQVRLVLAATLGASYGIYGPAFELCESRAVPGTEEYLDSEKYQIRRWENERPGNLRSFIARVNRIRRENEALHHNRNLQFFEVDNDRLIFYGKTTPDLSNIVLIAVNLDPHHPQSGWLSLPLEELSLDGSQGYQVHDLLSDARYLWHGSKNYVRLDPRESPAHIFRVRRKIRTERDFDYYL
ncbi:MAG: alpha-1,4-glucan--maltose-1-phosphate maltosyltransferase [Vicinamibacteria bacterium]